MNLQVFCVRDAKAEAYLPPFFLPKAAMALRTFTTCCNSDSHQFGEDPEDFTLWHLGEFDDETATWHPFDSPICLGRGHEVVAQAPSPPPSMMMAEQAN